MVFDGAFEQLSEFDSRNCRVEEMRLFARLLSKEFAFVLKTTEATVRLEWITDNAWLSGYLEGYRQA